jgi:2-hydroxy-6-oxonona-2,4-dienedioate hydrolase
MNTIWTELLGQEFRQTYYDARSVKTRALEAGAGPALIFLHGTGGHAEAYVKNIAAHARHFHVYAIDMIGHGYSDKPDLPYVVDDFVNHLRDFLDTIKAEKAIISGESLGAMVGAWLAIKEPDRVEKLVLNTGILMPPNEKGRQELLDVLERSRAATRKITREAVRKRMEWLMLDPQDVTDELVEVRYQIYAQPGAGPIMRKLSESVLSRVIDPEQAQGWLNPEKLREIQCPTLVLWTRHNPGQPVELAEEGVRLIPDARLVVMESGAHWPQWEDPEEFNRLHLEFLTGRPQASATSAL